MQQRRGGTGAAVALCGGTDCSSCRLTWADGRAYRTRYALCTGMRRGLHLGHMSPHPDHRSPRDYFEPDQWPSGTPRPGTPEEVLHAAEFANSLCGLAWSRGRTLTAGLAVLAAEVGVPQPTLRPLADGTRWPSLKVVARLEARTHQQLTGWSLVASRLALGRSTHPACPPQRQTTNRSAKRPES